MADFTIAELCSGCAFSGFPSTTQHVTQNKHGTFFSVITTQDNTNYAAQTLKIFWLKPDNALVELPAYDGNPRISASQPAAIESFWDTGEVFAIWSNYITGGLFIEKWSNVASSTTPTRTVIGGTGTANGKFTTCIDEGARCIYFLGTSGYFFKITQDGNLGYTPQKLITDASNANYFVITQDEDGRVYVVCNAAVDVGGLPNYNAIMCLMSMNAHEAAPSWFAGKWGTVSSLGLPVDVSSAGPAVSALTGAQGRAMNSFLCAAHVSDGARLNVLYAQAPSAGERFFYFDDLHDCSMSFTSLRWSDVNALTHPETIVKRPLRCKSIMPRAGSGGIFERDGARYIVTHDNALNLVALKSTDGGDTWKEHAKTAVPVGSDNHMLHYVGGYRGWDDDTEIVGIVVDEHTTPNAWATGPSNPTNAATVHRWSLPV